jgi:hypothetical protein
MDAAQFNGAFWLAISASVSAFFVIVIGAINKSKCSDVDCCWGFFKCIRDIKAEEEIQLEEIKISKPETSSSVPSPDASSPSHS